MRTTLQGMDDCEAAGDDEPGRDTWDEAISPIRAFRMETGRLVMYDRTNPDAWIEASQYGPPIDRLEPTDAVDEDESADGAGEGV